ncbi:MAG: EamA family transporter [Rhodobacteraceae bacterium]|nr:EamA family transporter [Paracoccaceae bacterium]
MSLAVFLVVILAAALHAGWNALLKGTGDKLFGGIAIATFASGLAAAGLALLPAPLPDPASWPFVGGSVALQVAYYLLLAGAYRHADLGAAYPLMRGGAPLLTAAAMAAGFGEALPPAGWAGVVLISAGILGLVLDGRRRAGGAAGIAFALANVVVIAGYTVVDGLGVRRSGAPVAYTLWIFLLTALPLLAWAGARAATRARLAAAMARQWRVGLFGAAGTMLSYGAALWAMTLAPVALVAALRESSILFATLIAVVALGERPGRARLLAVGLVAAGVVAIRLAPGG